MKNLLLLLTLAFGLFTFAFSQQYGWKDISANLPGNPNLSDVFFVSDNEGWITSSSQAEIYHTTDGGATFEVQTTELTCNAIWMLNKNEGYAGGASGFVYRTIDGGENWNFHGTMVATLADISFPPVGDTGYCCGLNGNIALIHNTGVTKMTSNVNGNLYSISFPVSSEEGWVCGGSLIIHFINDTWVGDQVRPSGGYNAIYMVDTLSGWAVGDGGIIAHTIDGQNWFEQTNPDPDNQTLYAVFFLDSNEGWTVGLGSQILHTTNGGIDWDFNIVGNFQLNAIYFTSPTNGYVIGNGKTLLKYGELSGIEEGVKTIPFEIFPNPAQNEFKVSSLKFKVSRATVEIFDLNGRKLLEKNIPAGTEEIEMDVSSLQSGIYFCSLTTEKGNVTKKLIIQR